VLVVPRGAYKRLMCHATRDPPRRVVTGLSGPPVVLVVVLPNKRIFIDDIAIL
jgi:hypothetical protein